MYLSIRCVNGVLLPLRLSDKLSSLLIDLLACCLIVHIELSVVWFNLRGARVQEVLDAPP